MRLPITRDIMPAQSQSDFSSEKSGPVDWPAVVVFYILACAFSWPFFWWRDVWSESWQAWHFPGFLKTSTFMWGPGLAALVVFAWRGRVHPRTITFWGTSRLWSAAFFLIPLVVLAAAYLPWAGIRAPLVGCLLAVLGFFNIMGEELGWRGFLQDALRPIPRVWRYVAIGALWEAWHFTNRTYGREPADVARTLAVWYPMLMVMSAMIGEATDRSRSLVVAVTLHFWVDALMEVPSLMNGPATPTYAVFGASVAFWIFLLWRWPVRALPAERC
jgi:hypothetical protein